MIKKNLISLSSRERTDLWTRDSQSKPNLRVNFKSCQCVVYCLWVINVFGVSLDL